jgi:hypothetical protein
VPLNSQSQAWPVSPPGGRLAPSSAPTTSRPSRTNGTEHFSLTAWRSLTEISVQLIRQSLDVNLSADAALEDRKAASHSQHRGRTPLGRIGLATTGYSLAHGEDLVFGSPRLRRSKSVGSALDHPGGCAGTLTQGRYTTRALLTKTAPTGEPICKAKSVPGDGLRR